MRAKLVNSTEDTPAGMQRGAAAAAQPATVLSPGGPAGIQHASPLNVLLYLCFPGGGIGRYSHELMQQLGGVPDIAAELVCLPSYHWLERADYATWPGLQEIGHRNPVLRKMRFLAGQFRNPARLSQHAGERSADIVHLCNINHLTFPLWNGWLRKSQAGVVATAHDVRRAKAMLLRPYEDRQLRRFYQRADALFVHSQAQADDLLDFAHVRSERVHIVPHGPYDYGRPSAGREELRRSFGWPLDKQVALFFGNVRDDKNLDIMLRALRAHRNELHVVVAGRGTGGAHRGIAYYRQLADELGVQQNVTFDDRYIADEEIPNLFEASDWAALPYSRSFTSQSGVLNVAVSYERPVLLSETPTFVETVGLARVGVLAAPDDVQALTEGVGRMISAIRDREAFEFSTYQRLFGWEANINITCDVYRSLCG